MSDMPETYQSAELDGEFDDLVQERRRELAAQDIQRLMAAAKSAHSPLEYEYQDVIAIGIVRAILEELMKPSELERDLSIEAIMEDEPPSSHLGSYLQALKEAA